MHESDQSPKGAMCPSSSLQMGISTMDYIRTAREAGCYVNSSLVHRVYISLALSITGRRCQYGSSSASMTTGIGRSRSQKRCSSMEISIASLSTGDTEEASVSPLGLHVSYKTALPESLAHKYGIPSNPIPSVILAQPRRPLNLYLSTSVISGCLQRKDV